MGIDAGALDTKLRDAGIPIYGVSVGDSENKNTWWIHFKPSATSQQRTDAAAIVAGFDPAAEDARQEEIAEAPITARQWFRDHPAAIAFIRKTPAEQSAQIAAMNNAQLLDLVTHLTIAVSALIKQEFID